MIHEVSLHLKPSMIDNAEKLLNEHLKQISENFQLVAMPNPTNVLTRHAFMINGMDNDSAETAQNIRTEILKGKKAQVENPSASERAS